MTPITFTGVDVETDLARLRALAAQYPSVEFAVLAGSKTGLANRFPPQSVIQYIAETVTRTALHLCGRFSRDVNAGRFDEAAWLADGFGRIQVNATRYSLSNIGAFQRQIGKPVIVQWRGANMEIPPGVEVLFDASGGRGIENFDRWPRSIGGTRCGYAGGLGPANIRRAVEFSMRQDVDVWLDMETGVRTPDDWLELDLVEKVLRVAGK